MKSKIDLLRNITKEKRGNGNRGTNSKRND